MSVLSALQPQSVFSYFERICSVPHGSHNTKQLSDLCVKMAAELGLKCRQDELNNIVIWKDATPGYENAPTVMLQGHMDMVCVQTADSTKDMAKEGLDLRTDGEWIWADKTSLGGDDGVALAVAFAVLADDTLRHPALEAVFTVDEEVGMGGVNGLDCSDLKSRRLINLDSEEFGKFLVSCTGAARMRCLLPGSLVPVSGMVGYAVTIDGLKGGHSGTEIHTGRGNAHQLMSRVLYNAMERVEGLRLADMGGGQFNNVIIPEDKARVAVPADQAAAFETVLSEMDAMLKSEYLQRDDGVTVSWEKADVVRALDAADTRRILGTMLIFPQGVQAMSAIFPGVVQTSLNVGIMSMEEDGLHFFVTVRSCVDSHKELILQQIEQIIRTGGGSVEHVGNYNSWQFAPVSPLRDCATRAYRDLMGEEPQNTAIHGGVECGILQQKIPGLDAIGMGPDLLDIHSARERMNVSTLAKCYELVCHTLELCH